MGISIGLCKMVYKTFFDFMKILQEKYIVNLQKDKSLLGFDLVHLKMSLLA